jgi:hypothetical protein
VERQQLEPELVPQARQQVLHWEERRPNWERQPKSERWPAAAPQEPHYHPAGSNSVPAHQPEPEQALSFGIHPESVLPKELSLLQKRGIFRAWIVSADTS